MSSLLRLLFNATAAFSVLGLLGQTPKYANAFLDVGIGARGIAMSQAVVASATDVTAAFWNPAGLTGMRRDIQFGFMHHEHFEGIVKFDYGGLAVKFSEKDAGAFTFIRSGVDDIPNTLELLNANGNAILNDIADEQGFIVNKIQE